MTGENEIVDNERRNPLAQGILALVFLKRRIAGG